jgi:methanogenic corrinoid protein MtbC1
MLEQSTQEFKVESFYQVYLKAISNGAFAVASKTVQEALQDDVLPVTIYDNIFAPSLRKIGQLWETGEITVAQEHMATGITEYCRTLLVNLPSPATQDNSTIGKVLLTNINGNQHTLGLNLLADTFRWYGWEIFPLITPLPIEQLIQAASLYKVDLVCLSVAIPAQITRAVSTIIALRQSNWKGLIEIGGPAFVNNHDAAAFTGADFLGIEAASTVETAGQLLLARRKV